jgi:alpha-L-rhamnosidase
LAYTLLLNETFPSWGYSIRQGATTIWERWDGWTEENGFQDPGMNSFNHYSLGSVCEWMFRYAAGIETDPSAPGYKRIILSPNPDRKLPYVKASFESIHGTIASDWRIDGDTFSLDVTIPANTTAFVHVPADLDTEVLEGGKQAAKAEGVEFLRYENGRAVFSVGSGAYSFASTFASLR